MDISVDIVNKPKQTSLLKKLKRLWGLFLKFNDARKISKHFSRYFLMLDAQKPELKKVVYGIRYQVYCIEEEFEPANDTQQERDEFDAYSLPASYNIWARNRLPEPSSCVAKARQRSAPH